jgi:hypothetical protein
MRTNHGFNFQISETFVTRKIIAFSRQLVLALGDSTVFSQLAVGVDLEEVDQ